MSDFPDYKKFSIENSKKILKKLSIDKDTFILKKSKNQYIYDIDHNKYIDFFLNNGEILENHAPQKLTKFIKNALSAGLNSLNHPNKFLFKSTKLWQEFTNQSYISYYPDCILALLSIIKSLNKKTITIGFNNQYIYEILKPLESLVILIDLSIQKESCVDILIFESLSDKYEEWKPHFVSSTISIKIHSRFLLRNNIEKIFFEKNYYHLIHSSPFGGKNICLIACNEKIPGYFPSFEDGILYLEGIKELIKQSEHKFPDFHHPKFISYHGFAVCKENLDSGYFIKHGIFLKKNVIFFSLAHTPQNIKRLHVALSKYFNHKSNDSLDQK